ncbi:MAG: InlB B-repeat-containing protein, partial [bacterium]
AATLEGETLTASSYEGGYYTDFVGLYLVDTETGRDLRTTYAYEDLHAWEVPFAIYTLSYDANGGAEAPEAESGRAFYTVSAAEPTRLGYTFRGWALNADAAEPDAACAANTLVMLREHTTLYAVWEAIAEDTIFGITRAADKTTVIAGATEEGVTLVLTSWQGGKLRSAEAKVMTVGENTYSFAPVDGGREVRVFAFTAAALPNCSAFTPEEAA